MATVHPYRGYLNTLFYFYAKGTDNVSYKINLIEKEPNNPILEGSFSPNTQYSIILKEPGSYKIVFNDGTTSEIIVEDGYKFGGSKYKTSFIFDETPWCFIIMKDRTYFYNRETEESYVEVISPDKVTVISENYVIFENRDHDERTIYSLGEQKPILNVANIVTFNTNYLVWQENTKDNNIRLNIYSLSERRLINTLDVTEFMVDLEENSIVYVIEDTVYKQDLRQPLSKEQKISIRGKFAALVSPNLIISLEQSYYFNHIVLFDYRKSKTIADINVNSSIASINSKILIDVNKRIEMIKAFDFAQIGCEEVNLAVSYLSLYFYPTKWDVYYTVTERTYKRFNHRSENKHSNKFKSISSGDEFTIEFAINNDSVIIRDSVMCFYNYNESIICGKNIRSVHSKGSRIIKKDNDIIQQKDDHYYVLDNNKGWILRDGIYKNRTVNSNNSSDYDSEVSYKIASKSESGKWMLIQDSDGMFISFNDNNDTTRKKILSDLYDTSSYKSVLLSEDGSQILYRDNKETIVLDINLNKTDSYNNLSYIEDVNGIRPLFSQRAGSLQPRLVDPITGQFLSHQRMPAYHFVSPNGLLYADTELNKYVETWDLINNKLLSEQEYLTYLRDFDDNIYSAHELDKSNKEKRRRFIVSNYFYFENVYNKNNYEQLKPGEFIDKLLSLSCPDFVKYFIERRGVVYIRNKNSDSVVAKIDLGIPLWFLNYVSFSYDNRYVAIAGRYPNNSKYGGLFLVYDLIKDIEVLSKKDSRAVWLTAFNRHNQVAAYSSEPISYDAMLLDDVEDKICINSYNNRNFLSFSPDGEYAALSNQGYVSKYDKYGSERLEWGHRPSCDVFIVRSSQMDFTLMAFSDLSNSGIEGLSDRNNSIPKTVSSVSFSNDNKRLMMVGNDGVVIIRNLHLEEYADE